MSGSGLLLAAAFAGAAPHVDLITMGQGAPVFERFGHAAICVTRDRSVGDARCYNYGTTDFDTPPHEIGWKFVRGSATFWVSVTSPERMFRSYRDADRSIWRQRLPLDPQQARRLAVRLAHDAREENRYYTYHHLRDNCSTRIRDLLDDATGGALSRGGRTPLGPSYRQLGRERLRDHLGLLVGSDLVVGRAADRRPSVYEGMFLPSVLRREVELELGATPEQVYARSAPLPASRMGLYAGWGPLLGGLFVGVLALGQRFARLQRLSRALVGVALATLGLLPWAVAIVSSVPELRVNEALLVFVPCDVTLAWLRDRTLRRYLRIRLGLLLLVSIAVALGLLKQPLFGPALAVGLPMFFALILESAAPNRSKPG